MPVRPGAIARLRGWFHGIAERLRDERELARMGSRELSDIGASRADLDILIHAPFDAPKRLEAMLRRLRIDPNGLVARRWLRLDLERTCALCGERHVCRSWLASRSRTGYERFCPNAERLRQLKLGGEG
ncbi:MAG TPA: hypothetical protein VED46_08010 [Alphaproteobacteria bacterium]|nr:hypothetical protein [Alphaproteobacteria bacterium]